MSINNFIGHFTNDALFAFVCHIINTDKIRSPLERIGTLMLRLSSARVTRMQATLINTDMKK
jgi:hypothetical protein